MQNERSSRSREFWFARLCLLVFSFIGFVTTTGYSAQTTIFSADFEDSSGDNNWTLVGGSTDANWQIGGSQEAFYFSSTNIIQLEPYAGSGALVTGLSSDPDDDVDGTSIARSPTFTIPANAASAEFSAYGFFGHSSDGETGDSLLVEIFRASDDSKLGEVVNEIATIGDKRILDPGGANSGYTFYTSSMSSYVGIPVYFQVSAIDISESGTFSYLDGGLDDINVIAEVPTPGEISGSVYDDSNNSGTKDAGESGLAGVLVTVYSGGGSVGSDTTDANGDYTVTGLVDGADYRIEFTAFPSGYNEGPAGSDSGTSTAFAESPSIVMLGVSKPSVACSPADAKFYVSCFINGDPADPSNMSETAIAGFNYIESGFIQSTDGANTYTKIANMDRIGPVWGLAYDEVNGILYSSAVVKRHSGMGPGGVGAIYIQSDLNDPASATILHNLGSAAGTIDSNATRFPGSGTAFGEEGPCKS
ncbi:MAG: SdrD B-like domain-containing protein, partial [Verrucomicrobiota bacterium]